MTCISYNAERASFIDYTMPVDDDGAVWVSMPPKTLPPIKNITLIFDSYSWTCIFVSIILVTAAFLIITRHA